MTSAPRRMLVERDGIGVDVADRRQNGRDVAGIIGPNILSQKSEVLSSRLEGNDGTLRPTKGRLERRFPDICPNVQDRGFSGHHIVNELLIGHISARVVADASEISVIVSGDAKGAAKSLPVFGGHLRKVPRVAHRAQPFYPLITSEQYWKDRGREPPK